MLQTVQASGAPDAEVRESGPGTAPPQPAAVPILVHYWQTFLRWKWVIAGILTASLAIALIVTLLTTPVYTAAARIDISREQQNVTSVEGLEFREAFRDDESTRPNIPFWRRVRSPSQLPARAISPRTTPSSKRTASTRTGAFSARAKDGR